MWSPQQERALSEIAAWLANPNRPQIFRCFGFAGTGKTTLARHFAEGVDGTVLFGAFTGKAAYVMQQKGCVGAQTIHQMIYRSNDKSGHSLKSMEAKLAELLQVLPEKHPDIAELRREIEHERKSLSRPSFRLNYDSEAAKAALVIIDECSMVDADMATDLLFFKTPVLVLGDPAQLPPVYGEGYFTSAAPDVMLTEVHRQAEDNPILHMATRVREGKPLALGSYGNSKIIDKSKLTAEVALTADQLIVGRNVTRFNYNKRLRQLHNFNSPLPEQGDKLVCLRNNHEVGLLNGGLWSTVESFAPDGDKIELKINGEVDTSLLEVKAHTHYFLGKGKDLDWFARKDAEEFDFGYALTCHKAQGSQWDNVLIMDESRVFRDDKAKWLYTAITRAAKEVTIAR